MGSAKLVCPMLGVAIWAGVVTWGGVGTLGGVAARGGLAARGSVAARGGVTARGVVGTLGGVSARGDVYALCRRISGVSSSSSSVKLATTLRHFWLLSSSSMIKGPPVPKGPADFFYWEGPSAVGRFLATFLITRGSRTSTPTNQSLVGMSETYTAT
jgi:hypothetical protein